MASDFAERIYSVLKTVPPGRVITYGALAAAVDCRSARAVGQALKVNPYVPEVPCHRVIGADLRPGGYQGETGGALLQRKLALLAAEGVTFNNGRLAEPARVIRPGRHGVLHPDEYSDNVLA